MPSAPAARSLTAPVGDGDDPPLRGERRTVRLVAVRDLLAGPTSLRLRTQVSLGAAFYLLLFVVLVVLAVNGTSSGIHYSAFFSGPDPQHVLGPARAIRSDEYFVTTPLIIAQVQQGLPRFSAVYPGGMDMSILWDLPYADWSLLFRPHEWAFFVLPLDNAFAFRWWLPALAMAGITYALLVTLWRRPLAALAVSVSFLFSPFFQWWFGAGSFWPPAFAVALVLATVWLLGERPSRHRWAIAAGVGYLGAVAAVSLYPAFLVPSLLAGVAGAVGWCCAGPVAMSWRERVRRMAPLAAAGTAAVAAFLVYLSGRASALDAITSTLYPGDRSWATGQSATFPWAAMYGGVFQQGLGAARLGPFAPNPSEGAGFLLVGLYLLPVVAWLVADRWRRSRLVDWALVAPLVGLGVVAAFIYLPGWDALARLVMLDTTTTPRIVIGLGVLSLLLLAVTVHRLLQRPGRPPVWAAAAALLLVVGVHLAVLQFLTARAPEVASFTWWPALLPLLALAVGLFGLGRVTVPALITLVVSLAVCAWVNPIYQGVLDLRRTDLGTAIQDVEAADPGSWVTTAGIAAVAVLRETAVESYSGTQGWPPQQMWQDVDPGGANEAVWNRYAHVYWTTDPAAPPFANPSPDAIVVALDTCGAFAQEHLDHVVTDTPLDQPCARLGRTVAEEKKIYYLYDVVPAAP